MSIFDSRERLEIGELWAAIIRNEHGHEIRYDGLPHDRCSPRVLLT